MSRGSILIHTPDALGAKRVSEGLRDAGYETVLGTMPASKALMAARAVDLLLVDDREPHELATLAEQAKHQNIAVVLLSATPAPAELLAKLPSLGVSYLIAVSGAELDVFRGVCHRELIAAIDSLLDSLLDSSVDSSIDAAFAPANNGRLEAGSRPALEDHNVARYLPEATLVQCRLEGDADREQALQRISRYLEGLPVAPGLAATITLIADELASNALRHGAGPFALSYGSDGDLFAVSVRDSAGALRLDDLVDALDATSGTRRGLLAAMHGSSQLVFHLAEGASTEVIACAKLCVHPQMHPTVRSVHVFIDNQRALEQTGIPQSVQLSESLRIDLRDQLAVMTSPPLSPARSLAHSALRPRESAEPTAPLRRRPRATPNALTVVHQTSVGVDTLRGILRGAADLDLALESAIRFLAGHTRAAVLYRRDHQSLTPYMAGGQIARWHGLGQLEPWLGAPSTPAIVARDHSLRAFAPQKHAVDHRILASVGVNPTAQSWALPISTAGDTGYVLCAFEPSQVRVVVIRMLLDLRVELEDALARLSSTSVPRALDDQQSAAITLPRRLPTVPLYAEMELLYPRALRDEDCRPVELDL